MLDEWQNKFPTPYPARREIMTRQLQGVRQEMAPAVLIVFEDQIVSYILPLSTLTLFRSNTFFDTSLLEVATSLLIGRAPPNAIKVAA